MSVQNSRQALEDLFVDRSDGADGVDKIAEPNTETELVGQV